MTFKVTQGHCRCYHLIGFYYFLLVCHCKCMPIFSGGSRGMRPHPPQLGQKFFERLYFGHCEETEDQIRMPFGVIGRTGPGMRQVVGFGDRSTGRGTFEGEFGACHCDQWGLYSVRVRQCRDTALFPNCFGQTCYLVSLSLQTYLPSHQG